MYKNIFLIFFFYSAIGLSQSTDAQHLKERFTHGAENGYSWWAYAKTSHTVEDYRYNYLASMLEYHRGRKQLGLKPRIPVDCFDDIYKLSESGIGNEIDLYAMVKLVDNFYSDDENLIIPILGAYCYCIKSLAGLNEKDLEKYRQELLTFSRSKSEQ
jgi:hypothetical protein